MLTSKQRAQLRAMAANQDTIMQIGKSGVTAPLIATVNDALEARELIKLRALETCGLTARDVAEQLADALGADVVCVIGTRCVLYRESKNKKKIELC